MNMKMISNQSEIKIKIELEYTIELLLYNGPLSTYFSNWIENFL